MIDAGVEKELKGLRWSFFKVSFWSCPASKGQSGAILSFHFMTTKVPIQSAGPWCFTKVELIASVRQSPVGEASPWGGYRSDLESVVDYNLEPKEKASIDYHNNSQILKRLS